MTNKLLIVEDNLQYVSALKKILNGRQLDIFTAQTSSQAIDYLSNHFETGVILLDLRLKNSSGIMVLEYIKPFINRYRVIVITGHEEDLDADSAGSFPVFYYLSKDEKSQGAPLLFSVDNAFRDLENDFLKRENTAAIEIQNSITKGSDLPATISLVCRHIIELAGGYTCHIRVFDDKFGDLKLLGGHSIIGSFKDIFEKRIEVDQFLATYVHESSRPKHIQNLQESSFMNLMKKNADYDHQTRKDFLARSQSAFLVPIKSNVHQSEVEALLVATSEKEPFFSDQKQSLILRFAEQAGLAITNHYLRYIKKEIHDDYDLISKMLTQMTVALRNNAPLDAIYQILNDHVSQRMKPEIISVFLFDESSGVLRCECEFRDGTAAENPKTFYPGQDLIGEVFECKESKRKNLAKKESPLIPYDSIPSGSMAHFLGAPMLLGDRCIGVLQVVNKKSDYYPIFKEKGSVKNQAKTLLARGFSRDCEIILNIAASHLAVTLETVGLKASLQTSVALKRKRLTMLFDLGEALTAQKTLEDLFEKAVSLTSKHIRAEETAIFLEEDGNSGILAKKAVAAPNHEIQLHLEAIEKNYGTEASLTKSVFVTKEPKLINRVSETEVHAAEYREILPSRKIKHFLGVPLILGDQCLGVLRAINRKGENYDLDSGKMVLSKTGFDEEDRELMQTIASQVAIAIDQGRLIHDVRIAKEYFKTLVDQSPDPIIACDSNSRIIIFNKASEKLLGYCAEKIINKNIKMVHQNQESVDKITKAINNNPNHRLENQETIMRDRHGQLIPVSISVAYLYGDTDKKEKVGSMGVFKDLRREKDLQEKLLERERFSTIGKMAGSMGHDIKTELATILNFLEFLKDDLETTDRDLDIYTEIKDAVLRSKHKLQNMLYAGKPPNPEQKVIWANRLVNEMSDLLHRQASVRDVDLTIDQLENDCQVHVDSSQIRQVFQNLFWNALEAIAIRETQCDDYRGFIKISLGIDEGNLLVSFADNGCGIDPHELETIFKAFHTNKHSGNGLGLYTAKPILKKHNGTITVQSKPGSSTVFRIRLPII